MNFLLSLALGLGLVAQTTVAGARPFVFYGNDSRSEIFEVQDANIRDLSRSVVTLVDRTSLKVNSPTTFYSEALSWADTDNYCRSEQYAAQPSLGFCTGALIGPDIVVTAGHCLPTPLDCALTAFVFDYKMESENTDPQQFNKDNVFYCKKILYQKNKLTSDWAVIQIDRPVTGRTPVTMRGPEVIKNTPVFMIGSPMGIPMKYAGEAKIRKVLKNVFHTNLDASGGNSGSPVFDANTYEMLGILVSGEDSVTYDTVAKCNREKRCTQGGCKGETIMKIDVLRKKVGI